MSQTLYFGGPIVTMERELYVQALLTEGERILYAGSLHGAEERAEGTVRRVDLKGRALLPAFVDAHSHLTAYANTFLQAGLGECASWRSWGGGCPPSRQGRAWPRENGSGERATTTMSWRRGGIPPASCWTRPVRAIR